ncbi:MAG: hypothetical protein J0H09_11850 [Burkholderiales bacterium]|nr:hypothetical protein [Burkholderiales bacterium]
MPDGRRARRGAMNEWPKARDLAGVVEDVGSGINERNLGQTRRIVNFLKSISMIGTKENLLLKNQSFQSVELISNS